MNIVKKRLFKFSAISMALAFSLQLFSGAAAVPAGEETAASIYEEEELTEVVSLRTRSSKDFEKVEGYHFSAIYNEPVHFQNEAGEWEEIDNTLTPVAPVLSNAPAVRPFISSEVGYMENRANDFKVRLPNTISAFKPVFVAYEGYSLSFHMEDVSPSPMKAAPVESVAQLRSRVEKEVSTIEDAAKKEELRMQAMTAVANQTAGVTYESIMASVDVSYEISGQKLKESLILDSNPMQNSFSFNLSYTGLVPVVQAFGAVHFYKTGEEDVPDSEPVFILEAPYMFDSGDSLSMDISVEITPTAAGCTYTITPDEEWLSAADRVYPVTIDPTITTSTNAADIQDNGVNQSNPTTNYMTVDRMYVGSNLSGSTAQESRIYIRFPRVGTFAPSAYITNATMYLDHYETASYQSAVQNTIDIYEVPLSYNWNSSTITWNSQAGYTFTNRVASGVTDKSLSTESFDITTLVRSWYNSSRSNNGLVIKPRSLDKSKTNRTCFISSDISNTKAAKRPRVVIEYFIGSPTPGITDGECYYLRNEFSGRYISTTGSGKAVQYLYNENPHQKWFVFYIGGGLYEFVPDDYTNKRLAVQTGLDWQLQPIWVNQLQGYMNYTFFRIIANGDGTFRIQQATSNNLVIDLEDTEHKDGNNNINNHYLTRAWNGSSSQRWAFETDPNYGCGGIFRDISGSGVNCFGYALFINENVQPRLGSSTNFNELVKKMTSVMDDKNIQYRPLDNYQSHIEANEYRIAMRIPNDGNRAYHVIHQLSNGAWAGKNDIFKSKELDTGNPSTTPEMWEGYSGPTAYFAITRKLT